MTIACERDAREDKGPPPPDTPISGCAPSASPYVPRGQRSGLSRRRAMEQTPPVGRKRKRREEEERRRKKKKFRFFYFCLQFFLRRKEEERRRIEIHSSPSYRCSTTR